MMAKCLAVKIDTTDEQNIHPARSKLMKEVIKLNKRIIYVRNECRLLCTREHTWI